MTVLIHQPVADPAHSWDHFGENAEALGRAAWLEEPSQDVGS